MRTLALGDIVHKYSLAEPVMWLFSHPRGGLQTGAIIPNRVSNATLLLHIVLHLNKLPALRRSGEDFSRNSVFMWGEGEGEEEEKKKNHILTSTALMASVFMLHFIAPFRMHSEASAR